MITYTAINQAYTAQVTAKKMSCLFNRKLVDKIPVSSMHDAKRILECWAHFDISPIDAKKVYYAVRHLVGFDISELSLAEHGRKVMYRSKVIAFID